MIFNASCKVLSIVPFKFAVQVSLGFMSFLFLCHSFFPKTGGGGGGGGGA